MRTQPQADGDCPVVDITEPTPYLALLHKTGPAFEGPLERLSQTYDSLKVALNQSLSAQTARAIGQVLNALDKRQMLDVMPAWTRLLANQGLSVPFPGQPQVLRTYPRQSWEFPELREAVVLALCYAETDLRLQKWATADALLRGYAAMLQAGSESHLAGRHLSPEDAERIQRNAEAYRAFAEGRA